MSDGGNNMDLDSRIALTRMEGKIDRINDHNERQKEDMRYVREKLHVHGNEISALQAANTLKKGEQQGSERTIRIIWALVSAGGVAAVAAIARALGV